MYFTNSADSIYLSYILMVLEKKSFISRALRCLPYYLENYIIEFGGIG